MVNPCLVARRPRASLRLCLSAALLLSSAFVGSATARAETPAESAAPTLEDRAAARGLFEQARALMNDGAVAEACAKLEASRALVDGVGIAYHLARCYEELGRTASAWVLYRDIAARTRAAGEPEREAEAVERAAQLEPRLSRLRIEVAAESLPLTVRRDGREVQPGQWGEAIMLDPGKHVVEAYAAGTRVFHREVELGSEGDVREVRVAHEPAASPPPKVQRPAASPPAAAPLTSAFVDRRHEVLQPLGWALVSGGVAATAIGFGMYGAGTGKSSAAEAACGGAMEGCSDAAAIERADRAETLKRVGLPMGIAGTAGLVAGVVTLIAYGEAQHQSEKDALLFAIQREGAQASLRMAF